tara:strand:- start:310 stop:699 length:390 start_codon:yes stop_codon:yes gene_type:complete
MMTITKLQKEWLEDRFEMDGLTGTYIRDGEHYDEKSLVYRLGEIPTEAEVHDAIWDVSEWVAKKCFPTTATKLQLDVALDCLAHAQHLSLLAAEHYLEELQPQQASSMTRSYNNLEKKFKAWEKEIKNV